MLPSSKYSTVWCLSLLPVVPVGTATCSGYGKQNCLNSSIFTVLFEFPVLFSCHVPVEKGSSSFSNPASFIYFASLDMKIKAFFISSIFAMGTLVTKQSMVSKIWPNLASELTPSQSFLWQPTHISFLQVWYCCLWWMDRLQMHHRIRQFLSHQTTTLL